MCFSLYEGNEGERRIITYDAHILLFISFCFVCFQLKKLPLPTFIEKTVMRKDESISGFILNNKNTYLNKKRCFS